MKELQADAHSTNQQLLDDNNSQGTFANSHLYFLLKGLGKQDLVAPERMKNHFVTPALMVVRNLQGSPK